MDSRATPTPHQHLYALGQTVGAYDGLTTTMSNDVLHVAVITGGRVEQVTCVPRGDDAGRLWFWDAQRRPIAPAGSPDAPLEIARRLR